MSLETTAAALEDQLIDGLSYKLKNGANYVQRRESSTLFPAGGNSYSNSGVRVIRIPIVSDGWLDVSTIQLQYKLTCTDSVADTGSARTRVELMSGQHAPFGRIRLLCGGQQLEDIQSYNRFYSQMLALAPESYIQNYAQMGPGIKEAYPAARWQYFDMRQFGPGDSKTMSMPII